MTTGYGVEVWCVDSLISGRLVTGWRVVAQSLYRAINTEQGTLQGLDDDHNEEESAFGIDLPGFIGAVGYDAAVATIPARVRSQWLKDERVADVDLTASKSVGSAGLITITIDATVQLVDEGEAFALTISVADGVSALISAEAI